VKATVQAVAGDQPAHRQGSCFCSQRKPTHRPL
jgi:hypothetical protein